MYCDLFVVISTELFTTGATLTTAGATGGDIRGGGDADETIVTIRSGSGGLFSIIFTFRLPDNVRRSSSRNRRSFSSSSSWIFSSLTNGGVVGVSATGGASVFVSSTDDDGCSRRCFREDFFGRFRFGWDCFSANESVFMGIECEWLLISGWRRSISVFEVNDVGQWSGGREEIGVCWTKLGRGQCATGNVGWPGMILNRDGGGGGRGGKGSKKGRWLGGSGGGTAGGMRGRGGADIDIGGRWSSTISMCWIS